MQEQPGGAGRGAISAGVQGSLTQAAHWAAQALGDKPTGADQGQALMKAGEDGLLSRAGQGSVFTSLNKHLNLLLLCFI